MEKINERVLPQFLKAILTLFLVLLVLWGPLSMDAFAENSSITYQGDSKKFVLLPENTDLFQGFKGVMPGDELSQDIMVSNSSEGKVELLIKAELPEDANKDFLNQMKLTVYGLDGKAIFDDKAGEEGSLSEGYSLGILQPGDRGKLVAKLHVPIEMDNTYQSQVGKINWVFYIQEIETIPDDPIPLDPDIPERPATGDTQPVFLLLGASIFAILGIGTILVYKARLRKRG